MVDIRNIKTGDAAFLKDGADPFGAVRSVNGGDGAGSIILYIENSGDFVVPAHAIGSIHSGNQLGQQLVLRILA